jgi:hypothetical protein
LLASSHGAGGFASSVFYAPIYAAAIAIDDATMHSAAVRRLIKQLYQDGRYGMAAQVMRSGRHVHCAGVP